MNGHTGQSTAAVTATTREVRAKQVLEAAKKLQESAPRWDDFYREILGVGGTARKVFPASGQWEWFENSPEFSEIQLILATLRQQANSPQTETEPTRVITVRLPKSLHETLRAEAHDRHTSMNKLCITKLLQTVDRGMVPND